MGHEYLITVTPADNAPFVALCLRLGGQQTDGESQTFYFRAPGSKPHPTMPDASVVLDPGEVWLCDYGGPREFVALLLRHLLDAALTHSDSPDGIRVTQP